MDGQSFWNSTDNSGAKLVPRANQSYASFFCPTNFYCLSGCRGLLSPKKVRMVGNPTRKNLVQTKPSKARSLFSFSEDRSVLLVLGGSLGAKSINEAMLHSLETLHDHAGFI